MIQGILLRHRALPLEDLVVRVHKGLHGAFVEQQAAVGCCLPWPASARDREAMSWVDNLHEQTTSVVVIVLTATKDFLWRGKSEAQTSLHWAVAA